MFSFFYLLKNLNRIGSNPARSPRTLTTQLEKGFHYYYFKKISFDCRAHDDEAVLDFSSFCFIPQ